MASGVLGFPGAALPEPAAPPPTRSGTARAPATQAGARRGGQHRAHAGRAAGCRPSSTRSAARRWTSGSGLWWASPCCPSYRPRSRRPSDAGARAAKRAVAGKGHPRARERRVHERRIAYMHAFDKENGAKCPYMLDKSVHEKERLAARAHARSSLVAALPSATAKWRSDGFSPNRSCSRYNIVSPMNELQSARKKEKKRPAIRSQGGIRDFLIGTLKSECEIRKRTPTPGPMQGAGHWRSSVFAIDVGFHASFRWPGRWLRGGAGS